MLLTPFLDAMLAENEHLNLTGVRDREEALVLHILDSLQVVAFALHPRRCLDLGSGNGFPGIALCALYPDAEVTLMERTGKKVQALERILGTAAVGQTGLSPQLLLMDAAQAPALRPDLRGHFDLVTARALAPPAEAALLAAPLLSEDGSLMLWLTPEQDAPAELPPLWRTQTHDYELPDPAPRKRRLVRYGRAAGT